MTTQLMNNPNVVNVSDLPSKDIRTLRNMAVKYKVGTPQWRSLAPKTELVEKLTEFFPDGIIDMSMAPKSFIEDEAPKESAPKIEQASSDILPGLFVPKLDESFILNDNLRAYLSSLIRLSKNNTDIINTILIGPQGCGKTSVAYYFAAKTGLPLLKMNCPLVREPRDWFGAKRAENGAIFWDKALFAEAIAKGNLVVCLDEITRATPNVLNSLLPLLDWTRESYVEEAKEKLKVGPNTYFFATANIGSQFTGTFRLDSALADRFGGTVECGFLPAAEEQQMLVQRTKIPDEVARNLVKVANMVRNENHTSGKLTETISTRVLLDVAQLYTMLKEKAFLFTVLPKFSDDGGKQSERAMVLGFIQAQFPEIKNLHL